uniref:N-acetyltransferase domain-containing protein n=1 Tax=Psilocybe cubensis TaxID=181762 RepID=A0A8H7XKU7_PSICU
MFDLECGIRLRAAHTSPGTDYDNIVSLYNNAKVAEYMSYDFPVPQGDSLKEFFQGIVTKNAEMFCIVETIPQSQGGKDDVEKPRFVGMAALWVSRRERGHRHSEFGIGLMPEFWGKGYGKEITKFLIHHGFYHLNLHRISLETIGGNDRAITMYKAWYG